MMYGICSFNCRIHVMLKMFVHVMMMYVYCLCFVYVELQWKKLEVTVEEFVDLVGVAVVATVVVAVVSFCSTCRRTRNSCPPEHRLFRLYRFSEPSYTASQEKRLSFARSVYEIILD